MASLAQFVVHFVATNIGTNWLTSTEVAPLALIVLAPLAGALGAFVAGSATVSNLLMAPFLAQASVGAGVDGGLILVLQLVGAGAGNMISLQNLAAVQATVGISDRERDMLKYLWWPCALYVGAAILAAIAWISISAEV